MTEIDTALEALAGINMQQLRSEVDNLRAIKAWAMQQLGVDFETGDRVVIVSDRPSSTKRNSGWHHYREALAVGQTGTAGEIFFSAVHGVWQVDVAMDRTWSVHERDNYTRNGLAREATRYWNGPASETPDGYQAPSAFDQERHPDGKVKHFYMNVTWVKKAAEDDESEAA